MDTNENSRIETFIEQLNYPGSPAFLLAALEDVQAHFGWVPNAAIDLLAARFALSAARVHQLLDACSDSFSTAAPDSGPVGRKLWVCHGPVCRSHGADDLCRALQSHGLSPVGHACLGACDHAPAARYGEELIAPATGASVLRAVAD
ncbi:MAG: NAD(P)H-dependent oxidoreductase subunit E [Mariprofundaceae bacterium]